MCTGIIQHGRGKRAGGGGRVGFAALVAVLSAASDLTAANRLFIDDQEFVAGRAGLELFVKCDNDVEVYAISLALKYDPAVIEVTDIEPAGVAAAAEWEPGTGQNQIDPVAGEIVYGFLTEFDFGGGGESYIAPGSDQIVARITFNTLSVPQTSTVIDFRDDLGDGDFRPANALVDGQGNSYRSGSPRSLSLGDATLIIDPRQPAIESLGGNQGIAGDVFTVIGDHLDEPGLQVTVCGSAAAVALEPDGQTLTVTAPDCPSCPTTQLCCVDVEVCTANGCDTAASGFCYEPPPPPPIPAIDGFVSNTGLAGDTFLVTGSNFEAAALSVELCGADATFEVIDDSQLHVTAPGCGQLGWVELEVCNVHGCTTESNGFFYQAPPVPVIGVLENNRGQAGRVFSLTGANFSEPGLTVWVCDKAAEFQLVDDGHLQITAPECGQLDWAELEICNVHGCASEPNGYLYEPDPVPALTDLSDNKGLSGQIFVATGENFSEPGLEVTVCDVAATVEVVDDTSLRVTAPECGQLGWTAIEICNVHGCVDRTNGFFYEAIPVPVIGAIEENRGEADQIFTVRGSNFSAGALTVEVCGVAAAVQAIDDSTLEVTSPDCGADGWASIEICNEHGCATNANGFFYEPDPLPLITRTSNHRGLAGQVFFVVGANFSQPGLTVEVCGAAASFQVVSDSSLQVIAPPCDQTGPALLTVCNAHGCADRSGGFVYDEPPPPPPPVITTLVDNTGREGDVFAIVGRDFIEPNIVVKLCDTEAEFQWIDETRIEVTALDCGERGWLSLEICNDFGCDSRDEGFFYESLEFVRANANDDTRIDISDTIEMLRDQFLGDPSRAPCRDTLDVNDDGVIDVTDPIALLGYLFVGHAAPPQPFPEPGLDPTPDEIPEC